MKKGYKQTEVGVIPEDWEPIVIAKACKLINGRGFKPYEWRKEGLPIIRIQNLNGSEEYNYFQGSYDKKLEVENNQLLFAWSGSRGTSFGPHKWTGEKGLLNYHTWKVEVNENNVDREYFAYALEKLTKYIEDKAHGASALVHVQKWEMEKFQFPLPPTLTEQTAIATALSDTDALISSLEKLLEKKRAIKQGAMQELLKPKEGWVVKKLGEITLTISSGKSNTNSEEGQYPIYGSTGIIGWAHKYDYKGPKLLVARVGANAGVVNKVIGDYSVSDNTLMISLSTFVNMDFIFYSLISFNLNSLIFGSGQPLITGGQLKNLEICLPSELAEQTKISKVISDMDTEISSLEQNLSKYKMIKQGMMQELLTGKTRLV